MRACGRCGGRGIQVFTMGRPKHCADCSGNGWFMTVPELEMPCREPPGHEIKIAILAGRYCAGLNLWHERDVNVLLPRESDGGGLPDEACGLTQPIGGRR